MIKKLALIYILYVAMVSVAKAADRESFAVLYSQIPEQYVKDVSVEDVAVTVLKGISVLDNSLRVGNDGNKVSLYYRGMLQKSLYKPQDKNDVIAWVDLSNEITDLALQKSTKASEHDFEMIDKMMHYAIKSFDKDCKYYASIKDWKADRIKHQRNFGSRMEGDNLYLKVVAFNKHTKSEIEKALRDNLNYKGVIIDLRGSPGGMLGEAVKIADLFLDDAIVMSTKGKNEDSLTYYTAHDGDITSAKPMVVLVDGNTASAAEVLAVALQEQGRAVVVGTNSLGKGSIQSLISLPEGGVIALTNSYFYTPSGRLLHQQGIVPDICSFEMPENKNVDNLIAIGKVENCKRESRKDTLLELKIAARLLKN